MGSRGRGRRSSGRNRFDQDVEQVVAAEADLVAGESEDAGVAATEHLDPRTASETELGELVDVVGLARHGGDPSVMTRAKLVERNGEGVGRRFHDHPATTPKGKGSGHY
jgi:hypothetical protein